MVALLFAGIGGRSVELLGDFNNAPVLSAVLVRRQRSPSDAAGNLSSALIPVRSSEAQFGPHVM
jgi:hypothetical protein